MPRRDPACATCREKCRRCDRAKPTCGRCAERGLECKGYPEKFRFQGVTIPSKERDGKTSVSVGGARDADREPESLVSVMEDSWDHGAFNKTLGQQDSTRWEVDRGTVREPSLGNSRSPRDQQGDLLEINELLLQERTQSLLTYYDQVICPHQIMLSGNNANNPYRSYVLPLAYEQLGLLYSILGLSACHAGLRNGEEELREVADEYRLQCISCLRQSIEKGISSQSHENERDSLFATIQLLLLHDICESGVSTHGAHITGAMSICSQLRLSETLTEKDERAIFFLGNLAWLDIIRAFSDPKRLCFSSRLRKTIVSLSTPKFEQVNGCPRDLFLMVGDALECAKSHDTGLINRPRYKHLLMDAYLRIYCWEPSSWTFPDDELAWGAVGESFRHAFILYTSRLLLPEQPAEASIIQDSVAAILDAISEIPSCLIEILIFPLFIAGTDSLSFHSRHYIILRLDAIKLKGGFSIDLPKRLLRQVWEARGDQPKRDSRNILWTSFTDATANGFQNDYLII